METGAVMGFGEDGSVQDRLGCGELYAPATAPPGLKRCGAATRRQAARCADGQGRSRTACAAIFILAAATLAKPILLR